MNALSIPQLDPDVDTLTAARGTAITYATAIGRWVS